MHSTPRYTYGGDEFIFVELSEEMSLEANIRVMAITRELQEHHIRGVSDICPANASYMVRYDPDVISPEDLLRHLEAADRSTTDLAHVSLTSRVVDFPILFDDPWTREALMRARDRHQDPNSTDLEYAARINGFSSTEAFIEALCRAPYIVSMTGFVPGLPWCFQIAPREEQIEVPKYVRPRTYTPERAFGFGGAFVAIYPVEGAGGYQLFGISPGPIFDRDQRLPDFRESMVFPRPGDIYWFRPIDMKEYEAIRATVDNGTFRYRIREITFNPNDAIRDPAGFSAAVKGELER
ncbi:carboxyltransferase domain-containing protein [Kyrpidia sp.]|uniref:5-oxoprolinase subunit B family protein n=1 Tax=Kyrpidia sp. TaxID=2073077 RepID=UPI00258AEADB|nr:carboxyltransferase domain-containing protein [Kyrpidia sp.]MCL6577029.1 carboxyltransferase domain-containing protein [Kyrpidia sp.]